MQSLFDGTDALIAEAAGVSHRADLRAPGRRVGELSVETASCLVAAIYDRMLANFPGGVRSTSDQLWRLRCATAIDDGNRSRETMLEKAVANLAAREAMPGWFNQCSVASGIAGLSDARRAVDLVHVEGETARLIELKWGSDNPTCALFQVLEYGLAFVFARTELDLAGRLLMRESVRHVRLEVVGPRAFYAFRHDPVLYDRMNEALSKFVADRTDGTLSMSLRAVAFPERFDRVPFADGASMKEKCAGQVLSHEAKLVRDAFAGLTPADEIGRTPRFLPGVPDGEIEEILNAAPGKEIATGKFDHPESSAALAVNALGFFLHRPADLPGLPGCENNGWPAKALSVEATVRFPWAGGRHPVLDCLLTTATALVGIESKRYEPFRERRSRAEFSDAYWRDVWGGRMGGYERLRDALRRNDRLYSHLDAVQLIKHAFALRTAVHDDGPHRELKPILFYLFAEPSAWSRTGAPVDAAAKAAHRREINHFAGCVADAEVAFVACSYDELLESWRRAPDDDIRTHAKRVAERFHPLV